jgi:hypothetical protein
MKLEVGMNQDLITRYNYDEFTPEKVFHWLSFDKSPALGEVAPDFPLWHLDKSETCLSEIWKQNTFTIVEFGSFT